MKGKFSVSFVVTLTSVRGSSTPALRLFNAQCLGDKRVLNFSKLALPEMYVSQQPTTLQRLLPLLNLRIWCPMSKSADLAPNN